ncbi:MAG: cytochrome c oxidase subunit 3 [Bacteroidota bacterium]
MEGTIQKQPTERKKIHPHKFALWVAMGSITMMFAGFTSAYIVREAQGNWVRYTLPVIFWISTGVIILSSVTMAMGVKAYKKEEMAKYRNLIAITLFLGVLFGVMQYIGFKQLYGKNIRLDGNPSESFLFIITGVHLAHILGGVIALLVAYLKTFIKKVRVHNPTGIEVLASYWHFVDVLWLYLFVFFIVNQ